MGGPFAHNLLILPENQFASTAVSQLFVAEVEITPAVVLLHGPSGVGKSHLIHHHVAQLLDRYEGVRYRVLPMYEFATLNMEAASQSDPQAEQLLADLAEVDLLICEDLQHLDRQIWLQKKLVQLLDELTQAGGRVLLSSQAPIGEYEQVLPKLVSRFHAGVTASVGLPGEHSRISLLHHFAQHHNLFLPTQAAQKLARELPVSPRELFGSVVQLESLQRLESGPVTAQLVQQFLDLQQSRELPSLNEIARSVAKEFDVTVPSIRSPAREKNLLIARQVAMLLSRELIRANYAEIGAYYGGRSHSTVMHACRALQKKSNVSPELDYRLSQLRRSLQGLPTKPR